jgi:hypothetical protein
MKVDGYIVDIARTPLIGFADPQFFQGSKQLSSLLQEHRVRLVYPIAQEKWIVRTSGDGLTQVARRRSPKRGRVEHLFQELVSLPGLITHPSFSLEVLLTQEEEIWRDDGLGSWRRKGWSVADRRLVGVMENLRLETRQDFAPYTRPAPALYHPGPCPGARSATQPGAEDGLLPAPDGRAGSDRESEESLAVQDWAGGVANRLQGLPPQYLELNLRKLL